MGVKSGAVFLDLGSFLFLPECFEAVSDMRRGSFAFGQVQVTVFVVAGAQLLFQFCDLFLAQNRLSVLFGHEFPQFRLAQRRPALQEVLRHLTSAVIRKRMLGKAETESAEFLFPALSALRLFQEREVPGVELMRAFLRADGKPFQQQALHFGYQRIGIQIR